MRLFIAPILLLPGLGMAATYPVGPGETYTTLNALFSAVNLGPDDIVEVTGGVTYPGGVVVPAADGGSAGHPGIIRGMRVGGQGPGIGGGAQAAMAASGERPMAVAKGQEMPRGR